MHCQIGVAEATDRLVEGDGDCGRVAGLESGFVQSDGGAGCASVHHIG